jgi:hypothetical protein
VVPPVSLLMASKRQVKARSCGGKVRFESQARAKSAVTSLMQNRLEVRIHEYRCKYCRLWHIGHRKGR